MNGTEPIWPVSLCKSVPTVYSSGTKDCQSSRLTTPDHEGKRVVFEVELPHRVCRQLFMPEQL